MYVKAFGPLTVTVLSIAITNIFKLYNAPYGIKVVGTIPKVSTTSPENFIAQPSADMLVPLVGIDVSSPNFWASNCRVFLARRSPGGSQVRPQP